MDSAKIYLKKALEISEPAEHENLKEAVYGSFASYYKEKSELDSFSYYLDKHHELVKNNQRAKKQMVNGTYYYLQRSNETETQNWRFLGSGFLLVLAGVTFVLIKKNRRVKQFETEVEPKITKEFQSDIKISKDTEEIIKTRLELFEKSNQFLKNDISFPKLTSLLNTNAKYLNHFLKIHYNKDYTTYINDLRINYIINRLESNKVYLQYKISYLAEESGFSSHSTFSANFRRVTGYSPSEFIESLKSK